MTLSYKEKSKAFSLLELGIACAVVGAIAALLFPLISHARMIAGRTGCASNMRQIGVALHLYAADHHGSLPVTAHTTGNSRRKVNGQWVYSLEKSWIYTLADYLGDLDAIRICPADEEDRKQRILEINATSYLLNDQIFDREEYQRLIQIPHPSATLALFISNRPVSRTWDHAHCGEWADWGAINDDMAPDRHRTGSRHPQRLNGSANYLYMDGHVKTLTAVEMKAVADSGQTPWLPERPR